ncbi:MAG: cation diffusion facilitator family transporter [Pseudomonadota bacterium]
MTDAATSAQRELDADQTKRLLHAITWASLGVATTLVGLKLYAWVVTDSLSLLATLVDSFLDVFASLITFVAVRKALAPADAEHRYGHGKAEPLAALAQAAFITGSAVFLLVHALEHLITPQPLGPPEMGYIVLAIAIGASLLLTLAQTYVARRTGSLAISADRAHYASDLAVNGAALAALAIVSMTGWLLVDALFAVAVALYILRTAYGLARRSLDLLLDRELPDAQRALIVQEIEATKGLKGWHDLRSRSAGMQAFVQLHIELDGRITLAESHAIAEDLEARIATVLGNADVIIHQDPYPDESATALQADIGEATQTP